MATKIYNDDIIIRLMEQTGLTKEVVELYFSKLMETLKRNIQKDGAVEIDGFGTFRLVDMKERASVNINSGERIVIPSYRKLTFVPAATGYSVPDSSEEDTLIPQTSDIKPEDDAEITQLMSASDKSQEKDDEPEVEKSAGVPDMTPEPVAETPVDEFSGIDSLISTPESLDDLIERVKEAEDESKRIENEISDVQQQILALQQRLTGLQALGDKKQAAIESLSQLLANMEQNRPAFVEHVEEPTSQNAQTPASEDNEIPQPTDGRIAAAVDTTTTKSRKNRTLLYSICAILLLALLAFIFFLANRDNKEENDKSKVEQVEKKKAPVKTDSIASTKPKKPAKPMVEKVLFDGSTPLEILVTKHYGEHDIVFRVIQYNKEHGVFDDWRKIPVGTELLFPDFEQLDKKTK